MDAKDATATTATWNWRGTDREAAARHYRSRFRREPPPPQEHRDRQGVTLVYPLEVNDGQEEHA